MAEGEYQTTSALHSYFTVGAIGDIHVSGLGDSFIDKVNGGKAEQQQGDVTFAGEVDRVYTAPEPTSLIMIRCWGGSSKFTINTIATWWPGTAGSPFRNRSAISPTTVI